ncbi:hypothetical protein IW136_006468, partial [Coemansia sp. RSA 678]
QRRRALADRMRRDEASNCDNVLTYLVEQHQWIDKLVRRATSPNFDGAHGYISLILNTLRLAVQVDRRRSVVDDGQSDAEKHAESDANAEDAEKHGNCTDSEDRLEKHSESDQEETAMLPDLAYHDPATRARLAEYPLYRLQRWEISLLYSPAFRSHLRQLRRQAWLMARKATEFRLYDHTRSEAEPLVQQRPVPHFSPQRVRPPQVLENTEIKKKQLQINVDLLLGSSSASVGVPVRAAVRGQTETLDEVGVDVDSLFARMLGFTEDLTERPVAARGKANDGTRRSNKTRRTEFGRSARRKKTRSGAAAATLLDELGTESAEAICSALAGSSA